MLMLSLFRFAATMIRWSLNLATWLLARSLNMPEPVVHDTGVFVFVQVRGAWCAVWLPPHNGSAASAAGAWSAEATETVSTATALRVSPGRTRLRARRSKR